MREAEPSGVGATDPAGGSVSSRWPPGPALPACPAPFAETPLRGEGQAATREEEKEDQ